MIPPIETSDFWRVHPPFLILFVFLTPSTQRIRPERRISSSYSLSSCEDSRLPPSLPFPAAGNSISGSMKDEFSALWEMGFSDLLITSQKVMLQKLTGASVSRIEARVR